MIVVMVGNHQYSRSCNLRQFTCACKIAQVKLLWSVFTCMHFVQIDFWIDFICTSQIVKLFSGLSYRVYIPCSQVIILLGVFHMSNVVYIRIYMYFHLPFAKSNFLAYANTQFLFSCHSSLLAPIGMYKLIGANCMSMKTGHNRLLISISKIYIRTVLRKTRTFGIILKNHKKICIGGI